MRSRALILASLVVLAAVALVIGVAVAGAGQSAPLPAVSAPDLLAKMAQAEGVTAVSGEIPGRTTCSATSARPAAWRTCRRSRRSRAAAPAGSGSRARARGSSRRAAAATRSSSSTRRRARRGSTTTRRTPSKKVGRDGRGAGGDSVSGARPPRFLTPEVITLYLQQARPRSRPSRWPARPRSPAATPTSCACTPVAHRHRPRLRPGGRRRRDHAAAPARGVRQGRHRARSSSSASPA